MTADSEQPSTAKVEVALFITCLVDLMRPRAGFAALKLLQDAGLTVVVPGNQSCCGQPGYNAGDKRGARALAKRTIRQLEGFSHVVVPSGSCTGMLKHHYPKLLEGEWQRRARDLAGRVYELSQFLVDVAGFTPAASTLRSPVVFHDGCAGLRELDIHEQPRRLLQGAGVTVRELSQSEVCCGFGGTFCARMPSLSAKMADDKLQDISSTGVSEVVAGDIGCLLSLAGRARRKGQALRFRHFAEVLVNDLDDDGIGGTPGPGQERPG